MVPKILKNNYNKDNLEEVVSDTSQIDAEKNNRYLVL